MIEIVAYWNNVYYPSHCFAYYSKREAIAKYREMYNLKHKKIKLNVHRVSCF